MGAMPHEGYGVGSRVSSPSSHTSSPQSETAPHLPSRPPPARRSYLQRFQGLILTACGLGMSSGALLAEEGPQPGAAAPRHMLLKAA